MKFARTRAELAGKVRPLAGLEAFEFLQGYWLIDRTRLLEEGKKTGAAEKWSELRGFDRAVMAFDRLAGFTGEKKKEYANPMGDLEE